MRAIELGGVKPSVVVEEPEPAPEPKKAAKPLPNHSLISSVSYFSSAPNYAMVSQLNDDISTVWDVGDVSSVIPYKIK